MIRVTGSNFLLCFTFTLLLVNITFSVMQYPNLPRLFLQSYEEEDSETVTFPSMEFQTSTEFDEGLVSKHEANYIVSADVIRVTFVCTHYSFPITWAFPHVEQLPNMFYNRVESAENRASEFQRNTSSFVNVAYKNIISISLDPLDFFSVNITCASVDTKNPVQDSIHLFMQGKNVLENEGTTVIVPYVADDTSNIILPCRVSSNNISVNLEIITDFSQWSKVPLFPNHIHYDPKIGFTLSQTVVYMLHTEKFRCSTSALFEGYSSAEDDNIYVYFNLTKVEHVSDSNKPAKFSYKNVVRGNASVSLTGEEVTGFPEIQCCSGVPNVLPILHVHDCSVGKISCKLLEQYLATNPKEDPEWSLSRRDSCVSERAAWRGVLAQYVTCKSANIDFIQSFATLFKSFASGSVTERASALQKSLENHSFSRHRYLPSLTQIGNPEKANITEKLAIFVGKLSNSLGVWSRAIFFDDISELSKTYIDDIEEINFYTIVEYDRDTYYEGEPLLFFCIGIKYFYASGGQLTVTWKNGSQTDISKSDKASTFENSHKEVFLSHGAEMFDGQGSFGEAIFREPIAAHQEMKSVKCWMPAMESSEWDTMDKIITVIPSVAPKFNEKEEETVYFYLGDDGNLITCTVIDAKPFPTFKLLWNGKHMGLYSVTINGINVTTEQADELKYDDHPRKNETLNKLEYLIAVNISFNNISVEHHGIIECVAINVNKTVTRKVYIHVLEQPKIWLPISLCITGLLVIVIIILLVKSWLARRTGNG